MLENKKVKIYAGNNAESKVAVFGSLKDNGATTYSSDPDLIQNSNYENGIESCLIAGNAQSKADNNAPLYVLSRELAYLQQAGIKGWLSNVEYFKGSIVSNIDENGETRLYYSIIDNNINNPITDTNSWKEIKTGGEGGGGGGGIEYWNETKTYNKYDIVAYYLPTIKTFELYYSLVDNNNMPLYTIVKNENNIPGNDVYYLQGEYWNRVDNNYLWERGVLRDSYPQSTFYKSFKLFENYDKNSFHTTAQKKIIVYNFRSEKKSYLDGLNKIPPLVALKFYDLDNNTREIKIYSSIIKCGFNNNGTDYGIYTSTYEGNNIIPLYTTTKEVIPYEIESNQEKNEIVDHIIIDIYPLNVVEIKRIFFQNNKLCSIEIKSKINIFGRFGIKFVVDNIQNNTYDYFKKVECFINSTKIQTHITPVRGSKSLS